MPHFEQKPIPQDYYEVSFCLEESTDGGKTTNARAEFTTRAVAASLNDLPFLIQRLEGQMGATLPRSGNVGPLQMQDGGKTMATPWEAESPEPGEPPTHWYRYVLYLYRIERTEIPEAMAQAATRAIQGQSQTTERVKYRAL